MALYIPLFVKRKSVFGFWQSDSLVSEITDFNGNIKLIHKTSENS